MIRNSFLKEGALLTAFVMIFALGFTCIPAYASDVDEDEETAVEENMESDDFIEDTNAEMTETTDETDIDAENIAEEENETPAITVMDDDDIIFAGEIFTIRFSEGAEELTYSKNLELVDMNEEECSFLAEEPGEYRVFVTYASKEDEEDADEEAVEEYKISILSETAVAADLSEPEEETDESEIQWLDNDNDAEAEEPDEDKSEEASSSVRTMASTSENEVEEGTTSVGETLTIIAGENYEVICSEKTGYTIETTDESGSILTHVITFSKEGYYEFEVTDKETKEVVKTYKITVDNNADDYGMTVTDETTSDGTTTTTTETTTTEKAEDGTKETVTVDTVTTTTADGETTEDVEVTVDDEEDGETVTVDLTSETDDADTEEEVAEVEEAVAEAEEEMDEEIGKEDTTEVGKEDTTPTSSDVSSTGETKTGDTMNVVPWIIIGIVAVGGCTAGIYGYRKFRMNS